MDNVFYPKYRWFVLAAMVIITASAMMSNTGAAPLVGEISKSFGTSLGETTAMSMLTFMLAALISTFLGGFLTDRIGFVRVWIIALPLTAIFSISMRFTTFTPIGYIVTRSLQGFSFGPICAVIATICAEWFKPGERTYVAAAQGVSIWLGLSSGLVYTPLMLNITGNWRIALSWSAAPLILGICLAVILLIGPKPPVAAHIVSVDTRANHKSDFRLAMATSAVFVMCILALLDTWYQQAFNDMAPGFYAVQPPVGIGLGPMGAGSKLMWAGYAAVLGTLAAPFVVERIFKGKPRMPLFIGCTLSAMLMFCMRYVTVNSGFILILLPVLLLFFSSFVNPTIFGFIAKYYPQSVAGRLGGIVHGLAVLGAVLGLGVGSTLLHVTGSYSLPMTVMSSVIFIGGVTVSFMKVPKVFRSSTLEADS